MAWLQKHTTKQGRVIYHVHWRDQDGRHRSRSTKSGRLETAEMMRALVEREQDQEREDLASDPTTALSAFLRHKALTLAEESVGMYRRHLEPMLRSWSKLPMKDWSRKLAEDYLHEKRNQKPRPWSSTAVRIWIHSGRAFVKWAQDTGVAMPDFMRGIPYPRRETRAPRHLKLPALRRLLDAARGHRLEVAVGLAALAGMRRSEFRAAQLEDVDLEREEIKVRGTKRGRERLVPLVPELREILERRAPPAGALVRDGYSGSASYKALQALCDAASVDYVSFHQLRHSYASGVLKSGGTLAEVKDLLGHRNVATTSLYLHTDDDGRKAAAGAFARALEAAG